MGAHIEPMELKPCCNGNCGNYFIGGDIVGLVEHIDADPKNRLLAVPLRRKDPGHSFALFSDGTVEEIALSPCKTWRRRIKKAYRMGYRAVRFDELLPSPPPKEQR